MPKDRKRMLALQAHLARAERAGDSIAMARGYLTLAGELCRSGDRCLCALFIRKAEECLIPVGSRAGDGGA